jgi:hypothetical protein
MVIHGGGRGWFGECDGFCFAGLVVVNGDYDGDRGEGLKGCGNEGTMVLYCGFGMA